MSGQKILVLGGYGAVGMHLVTELRDLGFEPIKAGRDKAKADRVVDVTEPGLESYRQALSDVEVVANVSGAENARLASVAGEEGAGFVDVSATVGYLNELQGLDAPKPIIVDVGIAPGLSNLLTAAVHAEKPGPIDIAVYLGAGEKHGAAATDWSYELLGKNFQHLGEKVRNYSKPEVFEMPGVGRRRLLRLDFSDQYTMSDALGVPVRTYFGVDSRVATGSLAAMTWIPGASKSPRGMTFPGGDAWTILARGADGVAHWGSGHNQSKGTAIMTAVAVQSALRVGSGVHHLHSLVRIDDIPRDRGIGLDRASV